MHQQSSPQMLFWERAEISAGIHLWNFNGSDQQRLTTLVIQRRGGSSVADWNKSIHVLATNWLLRAWQSQWLWYCTSGENPDALWKWGNLKKKLKKNPDQSVQTLIFQSQWQSCQGLNSFTFNPLWVVLEASSAKDDFPSAQAVLASASLTSSWVFTRSL